MKKHNINEHEVNTMTFEQIKKDIRNCGLSQYFNKDGNLVSVFEHWGGTYDVVISSGGTSLRTSNVIARHENCDVQNMLNILGIS